MGQRGQRCRGPVVETPGPPCAWKGARDTDRGPTLRGRAVAGAARPFVRRLALQVNETVDLAMLDAGDVLFVDHHESSQALRVVAEIGTRFPLHCTASGKALLAALPAADVETLLPPGLAALTPNTIVDRRRLLRELRQVRLAGVAFDRDEHTVGVSAVGTTVQDATGDVVAITVVAPTFRFAQQAEDLVARLLHTRYELQVFLGLSAAS